MSPALEVNKVSKRFGGLLALSEVSLHAMPGEILGLIGPNGAGKSTLVGCITGVQRIDQGAIRFEGTDIHGLPPHRRARKGIGFVPQSLSFVGTLTAVENHLLGETGALLDAMRATAALSAVAKAMDVSIALDRPVERLSLGQRQFAEILSAIVAGARVLFLDEPTSSLGPPEIERLIHAVRLLADEGKAVALVTHRVREVLLGADDIVVLRAGEILFRGEAKELRAEEVARLMVGERSQTQSAAAPPDRSSTRLVVNDLSLSSDNAPVLRETTFAVDRGEILGVAGVVGPTQRALADALAGLHKPDSGYVLIDGKDVTSDAHAAARAGLAS